MRSPSSSAWSRLIISGFLLLLLNSAYLASFSDPTLWYYTQVALHPLVGIALAAAVAVALARGAWSPAGSASLASPCAASGSSSGSRCSRSAPPAASACSSTRTSRSLPLARRLLLISLAVSGLNLATLRGSPYMSIRTAVGMTLVGVAALIVAGNAQHQRWRAEHRIVNPAEVPMRMDEEGAGPTSPFFPSSANTNVNGIIPANFFMTSQPAGAAIADIYEQWNSSAHHFSSFNNQWYRKSIEYMQDVVGTKPSKWCAGCHDHAVFFNGRFDRPIKEQIDTPEAQAGLACTSCHSITRVHSSMGQGDFTIEYPPLHDLAASENPVLRRVHDALAVPRAAPASRTRS